MRTSAKNIGYSDVLIFILELLSQVKSDCYKFCEEPRFVEIFTAKTDGACLPDFEVSVSNLEFSQTRYGCEFQRFPPKFSSSKKYSREPFNFPMNIQFFIWSLCRCTSPRCCFEPCSSYCSGFGMLPGTKSIYISTASLQELKELGKYEYFFRVYHNNETD